MSKEAIFKIRETEEKAEAIVAEARKKAKELVEEARANALALRESAEADGIALQKKTLENLQKEREAAFEAGEKESAAEADELCREAALKKKNAERIVLRGLEDKCR